MTVTSRLCERIVQLRCAPLDAMVIDAARTLSLDGLAVGVAGSAEPAISLLVEHHQALGSSLAATVLGRSVRLSTVAASAVNGAAMHVADFEPMWSPANHALSTTLPVALALAEVLDVTGAEVLHALVDGIELQGWLRQASRQWEARALRFHPPGVVGPLGAAVTAAQLLRLNVDQLRDAIGMAASRSGGLMANVGTMTKSTHCGNAAAAGLEAALLAARGFTANPDILDAALGFGEVFSQSFVADDMLGFGPPYRVVDPGFAIKLFPSQYGTHFGITAGLALHRRIGDVGTVRAVRLTVPVMDYVDRPLPATGLAGKFSLQYTAVAALLDGQVGLASFTDDSLRRPEVQRLLAATTVHADPRIPGRFEEMHVVLDVDLDDGSTLRERCDGPAGSWRSPALDSETHLRKVRDCLAVLHDDRREELIEQSTRIDELDDAELRDLIALTATEDR